MGESALGRLTYNVGMSASGRKLPFKSGRFRGIECPLLMKADIHGCSNRSPPKFGFRMTAFHPKAAVGLIDL